MTLEGVGHLPLWASDGSVRAWAVVDIEDYSRLACHRWHVSRGIYPARATWEPRGVVYMHREVLGLKLGDSRQVDHIDRNPLNNRRSNLRRCSAAENRQNVGARSGNHWGVRRHHSGRWQAFAHFQGTFHHLGIFDSEDEAGRVASDFRRERMPFAVEAAS